MKKLIIISMGIFILSGCVFTKVVTVPMRVTGAVISVIPVVGDGVASILGTSADVIDSIPI